MDPFPLICEEKEGQGAWHVRQVVLAQIHQSSLLWGLHCVKRALTAESTTDPRYRNRVSLSLSLL